jgi:hypothetical protein
MSKKSSSWRRYSASSRSLPTRRSSAIDQLAAWLGSLSRMIRALLAGIIALSITGSAGLFLFSLLIAINPEDLNIGPINQDNIVGIIFMLLLLLGFVMYGVGWKLLIGFDLNATPLKPGRAAAYWFLTGLAFLFMTILMLLVAAVGASAPT